LSYSLHWWEYVYVTTGSWLTGVLQEAGGAVNKLLPLLATRPLNSQPQKGACRQNSTAPVGPSWRRLAVGPIPPADWSTRSTRSHLGNRPEHEIRIFVDRGVGPGVGVLPPVLGQVSPEGDGGQVGLGSSRFLAGL
jgi:hypothetical protein